MLAIISGTVFNDINRNATFDAGDTGIPNAYVVLRAPNGIWTL